MISDDLQQEIIDLEQELRDLKQIQGVLRTARAYSYSGTFGASGARLTLEITYADGDIPIIMYIMGNRYALPLKPIGNKQKVHLAIYNEQTMTFYSTREIKSVVRL